MKIFKHILTGNFWSFLLTLSGIIDVMIGFLVMFDVIHVEEHATLAYVICFGVGSLYFVGGILIAVFKMRREKATRIQTEAEKQDHKE